MRFEVPCCRDFIVFLLFLILSVMTGPVAVDAQISERALTQAEIVTIRGQQYRKVGDMLFALSEKEPTRKSMKSRRWTNGLVPYEFSGNVENENRERFRNATAMWMDRVPALEFVECQQEPTEIEPCDSEGNHIHVLTADENSSPVGMIGGEQPLNMVSWSVQGVILHELGHAIGFNHEHNRGDRDSFVEILWENIEEKHFAFYKQKGVHYAGYDFESIMHYRQNAFGMNDPEGGLLPTILPLPGFTHYTESMGARNCGDGCLSVSDIAEASRRYLPIDKASDTCTFTVVQNDWIEAEPNSTSSGSTYRVQPGRTWISTPTAHLQIRPSETNFVTGGVVSVAFPSETPNKARLFHDENLANPVHLDGRQYRYAPGEGPIDLWFWPDIEADAWTTVEVRHFDSDANTEALVFFTIHANCGGSGGGGNLAPKQALSSWLCARRTDRWLFESS